MISGSRRKSKRAILGHALELRRKGKPLAEAVDEALKAAGYRQSTDTAGAQHIDDDRVIPVVRKKAQTLKFP